MRYFKKKTLALILATSISAIGAFGADYYKNSLMSISFTNNENGGINVDLHTKSNYTQNLTLSKKDSTTYVIMLPETDSEINKMPQISGSIDSVDIRTMPYTNNNSGYTKITLKTKPNTFLKASTVLYIPDNNSDNTITNTNENYSTTNPAIDTEISIPKQDIVKNSVNESNSNSNNDSINTNANFNEKENETAVENNVYEQRKNTPKTNDPTEIYLLILGLLLVIVTVIYFYIKSKNKLTEIVGESLDIEIDDNKEESSKVSDKLKIVKNTVKKLDKEYAKPSMVLMTETYNQNKPGTTKIEDKDDQDDILDLDELLKIKFNETETDDNNIDLDAFLNNFAEEPTISEPEINYDDNFLQFMLNNKNYTFTKDDINIINTLIENEINIEAINNLKNGLISNPIKQSKNSKTIEEIVSSLSINPNISFTDEDITAIRKIMNVELDRSFVEDLSVYTPQNNNTSTISKPHKSSKMGILKVSDSLPNLEEALKKYAGKKIESEVTPIVYTQAEGYEFETISMSNVILPDLSKEINNEDAYKPRKSDGMLFDDNELSMNTIKIDKINTSNTNNSKTKKDQNHDAEKLLKIISEQKSRISYETAQKDKFKQELEQAQKELIKEKTENKTCVVSGKVFSVIKSCKITENSGCFLAKNNNSYSIIGYVNNNLINLKNYNTLKFEHISARPDYKNLDLNQYIIKIAEHKLILRIEDTNIRVIMELC